jgi:pimeloyl-ACP methyl ester carboxylesterase
MQTPTPVVQATAAGLAWATAADYERLAGRPVLVVHGAHDTVTPPRATPALHTWLGPQAVWVTVAGAGHNVMFEAPAAVNAILDSFLRGNGLVPSPPHP